MLRREVVQHHDASGGYELERPLTLGTHLRGRAALPAAAVEEEQAERRFRRQELVPVAMEDAHARVIGEEPARGRRAVLVELDA